LSKIDLFRKKGKHKIFIPNPHGGKDMYGKPLFVRAEWDEVARVWVATSDDVPGLATEEDNLEGLIKKLKVMIPELLDVNEAKGEREVPFELLTRRFEIAQRTSC